MTLLLRIDWAPDATEASVVDIAARSTLTSARETHHPAGAGHDVDRWLRAATVASRAALDSLVVIGPSADDIRFVELRTAAPGGLIALDADGAPLHDALLGDHPESAADADWLVGHLDGGADAWIDASGVVPTAGSTVALLSYLHRTDSAAWDAMVRCTVPIGLLAERLGARPTIGVHDGVGTAVADRRAPLTWRVDLLAVVDGSREWNAALPAIVDGAEPIGVLDAATAGALGVRTSTPLHIGSIV